MQYFALLNIIQEKEIQKTLFLILGPCYFFFYGIRAMTSSSQSELVLSLQSYWKIFKINDVLW